HVRPREADRQVCEPVPVEGAGSEGGSELVARFAEVLVARAVLVPVVVVGCRGLEPATGTVQHGDRPGVDDGPGVLAGDPDPQIVPAVAVEVTRGQRAPEPVADLGAVPDAGAVLVPVVVVGSIRLEAAGGPVQHGHGSSVRQRSDVLTRDPDPQVRLAVPVEVPGGQGRAEAVPG